MKEKIKKIKRLIKKKRVKPFKKIEIKNPKALLKLSNNEFIGTAPKMINSKIVLNGKNNVLICEENVVLENSVIEFCANNSIVYLSSNKDVYKVFISVNNNCTFYIGKDNYFNNKMYVIVSEECNVFIGDNGIFSLGIWMRTADPHLIYDSDTRRRLNKSKSIFLGDHVWIGQDAIILKGSQIESGSIIGAKSVVSGKKIAHNESWAGNPSKLIKDNIFWDSACVHKWTYEDAKDFIQYDNYVKNVDVDRYIYKYDKKQYISFDEIDSKLRSLKVKEKTEYLKNLNKSKNRFVSKGNN